MKKYSALIMVGVTSCSNMVYTTPDYAFEDARNQRQAGLAAALFTDSDRDGVMDYWDQCIETPSRVKVSLHGCPLDTNGNGTPDYQEALFHDFSKPLPEDQSEEFNSELIPKTKKNCLATNQDEFSSRCYGFAFDSDLMTEQMAIELNDLVSQLNMNFNISALEIIGHTDDRGSSSYNLDLSKRRAEAIAAQMKTLLREDVELLVQGMGEFDPMASNDSDEGRILNRRVEIYAIYKRNN